MAEKCPKCKEKVRNGELITECPNCKTQYHTWCWNFIEKCSNCGFININCWQNQNVISEEDKRQQQEKQPKQEQPQQETKTAKEYVNTAVNYAQTNINNTLNNEETGMFANVGEKLKSWAKANFVLGVIFGIITAIATIIIDDDLFLAAIVAGVMEIAASWAFSLILYAFGEVVSNSKESKEIQQRILDELRNKEE